MKSKQNRALKEFDSLYKMIDDVYHEIALSMHLTDSAFLILYCLLEQRRKLHMKFAYDIPDSFWSLFRSMNRELPSLI